MDNTGFLDWRWNMDDQRDFALLYRRSHKRAFNLAYRLLGNSTDAEDITQDAFVRAWRHFDQYDRARPFEGWLFRIVTNLVVDRRRRDRRVTIYSLDAPLKIDSEGVPVTVEIPDETANPETRMMADQFSEPLEKALAKLPKDYRAAVLLADVEGMSYQEIAEVLGAPIGTIRSRIHRGRLMLRRALEGSALQRAALGHRTPVTNAA
jgi:RNA polymerase sigma-70 factor, ECF subfamily